MTIKRGQSAIDQLLQELNHPALIEEVPLMEVMQEAFEAPKKSIEEKLASFGVRLREHGVKGQKWGITHHKEKMARILGGSDADDDTGDNALGLKERNVRNRAAALKLVQEAADKAGGINKLLLFKDDDENNSKSYKKLDKLENYQDSLETKLEKLGYKLEDLKDKLSDAYGKAEKDPIREKIAEAKETHSSIKEMLQEVSDKMDKMYDEDDEEHWNPSSNPRHALFEAAGITEKGYGIFQGAIESWTADPDGNWLRGAAKEIGEGKKNPSNLARALLVENAINREYFGVGNTVKLYRGIQGDAADKISDYKDKGGKFIRYRSLNAEGFSTSKSVAKEFADVDQNGRKTEDAGVVFTLKVPSENVLVSFKTNAAMDYEDEQESIVHFPKGVARLKIGKDVRVYRSKGGGLGDIE